MNPWAQLLGTNLTIHIKKYLFDVLKERYGRNQEFIDRLTSLLATDKDIEGLGRFVADLYETGYMKSLRDHEEVLKTRGFKATVKPDLTPEMIDQHRIFPKS